MFVDDLLDRFAQSGLPGKIEGKHRSAVVSGVPSDDHPEELTTKTVASCGWGC